MLMNSKSISTYENKLLKARNVWFIKDNDILCGEAMAFNCVSDTCDVVNYGFEKYYFKPSRKDVFFSEKEAKTALVKRLEKKLKQLK